MFSAQTQASTNTTDVFPIGVGTRNNPLIIDPTNMSPAQSAFLCSMLTKLHDEKQIQFIDEITTFQTGKIDGSGIKYFKFKYPILWRRSERHPDESRFEIVGKKLGQGGFSEIYKVLGTLAPQADGSFLLKQHTQRVIKKQIHSERHPKEKVIAEYQLAKLTKHLRFKYPTIISNQAGDISFTVGRFFSGAELFDLINNDFANTAPLTFDQRLLLTYNLLKGLQEQIHVRGVVHRDIKPENIITDPVTLAVHYIDLGLSKRVEEADAGIALGTPFYASYEAWTHMGTTVKSDTYALGIILSCIYHADLFKFPELPNDYSAPDYAVKLDKYVEVAQSYSKHYQSNHLFQKIFDADNSAKPVIEKLIKSMTQGYAEDRPDLSALIEKIRNVIVKRKVEQYDVKLRSEMLAISYVANQLVNWLAEKQCKQKQLSVNSMDCLNGYAASIECRLTMIRNNKPEYIKWFVELLELHALIGCDTKEDINRRVADIIANYKLASAQLTKLVQEMKQACTTASVTSVNPGKDFDTLANHVTAYATSILKRYSEYSLNLDDLVELTRKLNKEMVKFTPKLQQLKSRVEQMVEAKKAAESGKSVSVASVGVSTSLPLITQFAPTASIPLQSYSIYAPPSLGAQPVIPLVKEEVKVSARKKHWWGR